MLFNPHFGQHFDYIVSNHTTRPSASMGTAVSAGSAANVLGGWTQLLAGSAVAYDLHFLSVYINANTRSASARDALMNIGASPAGAGGYSTIIPNLLASCAGTVLQGGLQYHFPIYIPAGTALAANHQVNSASLGNGNVWIVGYGQPRNPESVKSGQYVISVGAVSASSAGTIITAGTTSEGAWTSLGSAASPCWWWQIGMGVNDATMNSVLYGADLGAGSPQDVVINNQIFYSVANTETLSNMPAFGGVERDVDTNTVMYGRLQCNGTADSNTSMIAYGVGG